MDKTLRSVFFLLGVALSCALLGGVAIASERLLGHPALPRLTPWHVLGFQPLYVREIHPTVIGVHALGVAAAVYGVARGRPLLPWLSLVVVVFVSAVDASLALASLPGDHVDFRKLYAVLSLRASLQTGVFCVLCQVAASFVALRQPSHAVSSTRVRG